MSILQHIVSYKKEDIIQRKAKVSITDLQAMQGFARETFSLRESLLNPSRTGIIAEYKRQSPSKGIINATATVRDVTQGYQQAGASAVSILTDTPSFGGRDEDLRDAREGLHIPILRKEFIVDAYQVFETRAMGADAILLIAAILSPEELLDLAQLAKSLSLSTLLEVHDAAELQRSLNPFIDAVGVNNRNLNTFETSVQTSFDLVSQIPDTFLKVSESAIDQIETIRSLKKVGYTGFLMGECFMKTNNPAEKAQEFMQALRA